MRKICPTKLIYYEIECVRVRYVIHEVNAPLILKTCIAILSLTCSEKTDGLLLGVSLVLLVSIPLRLGDSNYGCEFLIC